MFQQWEALLEPLRPLWLRAATRQPGESCRAFLRGDRTRLDALQMCLRRINELTYACLRDTHRPAAAECAEIGGMLDAICGPGE